MLSLLNKKTFTIYGDGKQVRDILYVSDLVRLFDLFLESDSQGGVFNVGGGKDNAVSLLQVIDLLENEIGEKADIVFSDWRPSDQKIYFTNVLKVMKTFNWSPEVSYGEGLKAMLHWYRDNQDFREKYCGHL